MNIKIARHFALFTIVILFQSAASAQTVEWIRQPGSRDADFSRGVSVGAFGDVYITGNTSGDIDGAGAGTNAGGFDAFISKYDNGGTLVWIKQLGTNEADRSTGITTDDFGNVYITGKTHGDLDGAGAGTYAGGSDLFVSKYSSSGTLAWTSQLGSHSFDDSNDVSVDAFGNVYITGTTSGLIRGSEVESYGTVSGAFITKHDSSGMLVWTKQFGAGGYTEGHGVSTDAFGNVYVSGYTDGDLDGGGAAANAGGSDAFLRKYDSSGTLAWTQHLGTSEDDASHGVTTDALGNVYVSGYTEGDLDGAGPGTYAGDRDAFVGKYDRSGTLV